MIIGHYEQDIWALGGLAAYIRRIGRAQQAAGHRVYYFSKYASTNSTIESEIPIAVENDAELYGQAQRLGVDLLHLHAGVSIAPPDSLPVLRTWQGHQPYCPSGSKYLKRSNQPCDRRYSVAGCLWGHLIDRCGSVRPQNLLHGFQATETTRRTLAELPTMVVSQFLKDRLVETGYPAHLISVLHLFAPQLFEKTPPDATEIPRFAFLGRITPEKGLSWLLRAIHQVNVPIHLDIAGQGLQEAQIREQIQQMGLNNQVTLHGWVNENKAYQIIQKARAVVYPSIWHEPGGTVAFEAMAHARALIMSRVGGMPEVVQDGVNGLLVDPNQVDQLARNIERLATDWTLAKQLGETGYNIVAQKFNAQTHLHCLMQLYEKIISAKTGKSIANNHDLANAFIKL